MYALRPCFSIGNETTHDGGFAHLGLLRALPAVRMCQDEDKVMSEALPEPFANRVAVDDVLLCAFEHVLQEIGKNIDDRLVWGERREALCDIIFETNTLRSQV